MAPITDDTVEALRDTIRKLESRVQQLEVKLGRSDGSAHGGSSSKAVQSVRMILMGPPGAGTRPATPRRLLALELTFCIGKGTQAPKIKDKYCACHLVGRLDSAMCAIRSRMLMLYSRQQGTCCDLR